MKESNSVSCIACRETIKEGATLCPHCGTSQTPKTWKIVSDVLKWIGGITAVISLVAGSLQLNTLHNEWQKKHRTVKNYVKAAKLQYQTGDIETAQKLLLKASKLDPASSDVLDFQINLLMSELRKHYSADQKSDWVYTHRPYQDNDGHENYDWSTYTSKREYLRELFNQQNAAERLALGSITTTGSRKAEILAHIAWLDLLVGGDREALYIEKIFQEALKADPKNAFAHLMYSAWLLEHYNFKKNPEEKFSGALTHLKQVEPADVDRSWFISLKFHLLSLTEDFPQSEIEMLRLVSELKHDEITQSIAADNLQKLASYAPQYDQHGNLKSNPKRPLLRRLIDNNELIDLAARLGEKAFVCNPYDFECTPDINVKIGFNYFNTMGFLYEETRQYQKAGQAFHMSWIARRNANWGENNTDKHLLASLQRVMEANDIPTTRVVTISKSQKDDNLFKGDLIINLNSTPVTNVDELMSAYNSRKEGAFSVTIMRNGAKHEFQPDNAFKFHTFVNYVVPTNILSSEKLLTPFSQRHNKWAVH